LKTIFPIGAIYFLGLASLHVENRGITHHLGIPIKVCWASYETNYWVLCHSKKNICTQNELALMVVKTISATGAIYFLGLMSLHVENKGITYHPRFPIKVY